MDGTTSEWTTQNGVNGRMFTSKNNGGKVFLPAAGIGYDGELDGVGSSGCYWSSVLDEAYPSFAFYLEFDSGYADGSSSTSSGLQHSVRPVRKN